MSLGPENEKAVASSVFDKIATQISPRNYLVRLKPVQDESWAGYLLRFSEENGYGAIAELASSLKKKAPELIDAAPSTYLTHLGDSHDKYLKLFSDSIYKPRVQRPFFHKICPKCWVTQEYVRLKWEWPTFFYCKEHDCLLVSDCPTCGRRINYLRSQLSECDCTTKFSEITPFKVGVGLKALQEMLTEMLGKGTQQAFSPVPPSSVRLALALRRILPEISSPSRPSHLVANSVEHSKRIDLRSEEDILEQVFSRLPDCLMKLLYQSFPQPYSRALHWAMRRMRVPDCKIWNDIIDEFIYQKRLGSTLNMSAQAVKSNLSLQATSEGLSLLALSKLSGLSGSDLKGMITAGLIQCGRSLKHNSVTKYRVSYRECDAILDFCRKSISLKEMAEMHRLKIPVLVYIAVGGFLPCIRLGKSIRNIRFTPAEAYAELSPLLNICKPMQSPTAGELINYLKIENMLSKQRGKTARDRLVRILRAARGGEVAVFRVRDQPARLGELFFSKADIEVLFKPGRRQANKPD